MHYLLKVQSSASFPRPSLGHRWVHTCGPERQD